MPFLHNFACMKRTLNILVPTDFSELSKVAIRYALDMAKKMKGKVTLVHVLDTASHAASMPLRLSSLINELEKMAEEDFQQLLEEVEKYNKTGKKIRGKIIHGTSFTSAISAFAKRSRSNLIIMGTHGASGLKKVFMGSNTTAMLEASNVPVLAIPPKAVFKSIKSVVYATDLKNLQKEFKKLLAVVSEEKPLVHMIHISTDRIGSVANEEKMDKAIEKSGYKNALIRILFNNSPATAINEYVNKIKVDMLALFPHKHTFMEKLLKGSVTKSLTFHSTVPLLAFKP